MVPTEHYIDISGRSLFALEAGSGEPAVIFEAGLGDFSRAWHTVQAEVAKVTRTISYDRAGRGQSQFAGNNRTCDNCLDDLEALLTALEVKQPLISVGHSFGGVIARLFAYRFPEKVGGLVLVDSAQEDVNFAFQKTLGQLSFPPRQFDEPQWLTWLRFHQTQHFDPAFPENILNDEGIALATCYQQVREAASLGALPLTVVSSTNRTDDRDAGATGIFADGERAAEQAWISCQGKLLELSTDVNQILATKSGHYIQDDQPELVTTAIVQMVERIHRENRF